MVPFSSQDEILRVKCPFLLSYHDHMINVYLIAAQLVDWGVYNLEAEIGRAHV